MIFEFSAEEKQQYFAKLESIKRRLDQRKRQALADFRNSAIAKQPGDFAQREYLAILEEEQAEIRAAMLKIEREHFAAIIEAGSEAILASAEEQAPLCLAAVIAETDSARRGHEEIADDILGREKIGANKDEEGSLLLFFDYAKAEVEEKMQLYIDELADDADAAARLAAIIEKTLRTSPRIDKTSTLQLDLPQVPANKPDRYIMPISKIAQVMQSQDLIGELADARGWDVETLPATKKAPATTTYLMAYFEDQNVKLGKGGRSRRLTGFEAAVANAVFTLYDSAEEKGLPKLFTPGQIMKWLPGQHDRIHPAQEKEITAAMNTLFDLSVTIDATDEFRRRGIIGPEDTYKTEKEHYFTGRIHTLGTTTNGKKKVSTVYQLDTVPAVLAYSRRNRQILSAKKDYLTIKKVESGTLTDKPIPMTTDRTAITAYILRRILILKGDTERAGERLRKYEHRRKENPKLPKKTLEDFKRQSKDNSILFETVFRDNSIKLPEDPARAFDRALDLRKFCFDLLDYYKATGLIRDYKKQAKGRKVTGIELLF